MKVTELITYLLLNVLSLIFSTLSRNLSLLLGKTIGMGLYFIPIRKKVARKNIEIAFKNKTALQREYILLKCYQHYGIVLSDFLSQKKINKNNLDDYFVFEKNMKQKLRNANGGCILSAHIGNWEMVLPAMGLNNIKMDTVVMRQSNKTANDFYIKLRQFKNINLIYKDGALRKLYRAINEGRLIGLASDQNARARGLKIDFFNKKSSFPKGAGKFYYKTSSKLFVVFCILRSDFKYYVYTKELKINLTGKTENEIIESVVKSYADLLADKIKQHPEQYFWFHKKWGKSVYN